MKNSRARMVWLAALFVSAGWPGLTAQTVNPANAASTNALPRATAPASDSEAVVLETFKVTGSYIQRDSFEETGAPVAVLTSSDALNMGAVAKPSEFLKMLPQNVGTWAGGGNTGGNDSDTNYGGASVDLRGLGAGATLVLLNGFRTARNPVEPDGRVDVNSLVPEIALERVEVLKNGASSLYGSDAVAGVVNFITRDDFNGVEVRSDTGDYLQYSSAYRYSEGIIAGGQVTDKLHIMAAFQYTTQTPLTDGMTGVAQANAATMSSASGWPGNMQIPVRNAAGVITGHTATFADPSCGTIANDNITTGNAASWGTDTFLINGVCRMTWKSYGQVWQETRYNSREALKYKVTPDINLTASVDTTSATSLIPTAATGPTSTTTFVVPGYNPGNTFRAVNSLGQPLYAVPSATNPSRPLLDANGNAVLTSNPTDPTSGIPFNENVTLVQFRPFSSTNGPLLVRHDTTRSLRMDAGLEGKISKDWSWTLNWTYSDQVAGYQGQDALVNEVNAGLNGTLGINHNEFYNPFGNSMLVSSSSPQYNTPDIYNDIVYLVNNTYEATVYSFDGVLTGNLFRLPSGPVGLAVGAQRRSETLNELFDKAQVAGELAQVGPGVPQIYGRADTSAAFAETSVPLMKNDAGRLDLSASARYEQDNWNDSLVPKVALDYKIDWFDFHGSVGRAFQSPSLYQRFGNSFSSGVTVVDPVSGQSVSVPTTTIGSPKAGPQKSDSFDGGLTFEPNKNLSVGIDYWGFNFTNLITVLTAQAEVNSNVGNNPNIVRSSTSGLLTEIYLPYFNAASLKTDGFDFDATYRINGGELGHFKLMGSATELLKYQVVTLQGQTAYNGLGTDNSNNFGFPMPKWRGYGGVEWDKKGSSLDLDVRYVGGVTIATAPAQSAHKQLKFDAQYSYLFGPKVPVLAGLRVSVGVLNLFNQIPNVVPAIGAQGYVHDLQDALPRNTHIMLVYSF